MIILSDFWIFFFPNLYLKCHEFYRYKFDHVLTKEELLDIISRLRKIGFIVVAVVSDMAACNKSLAKKMGITEDQPYFMHNGDKIFWYFDVVHLMKLVRNWLVGRGFFLEDGTYIGKRHLLKMFEELEGPSPSKMAKFTNRVDYTIAPKLD